METSFADGVYASSQTYHPPPPPPSEQFYNTRGALACIKQDKAKTITWLSQTKSLFTESLDGPYRI